MDWVSTLLLYIKVFAVGGLICVLGQILIDKTNINTGMILVIFVCGGTVLTLAGLYDWLVKFAGAGATVPLTGFGNLLAKGAMKEVSAKGIWGVFTGGIKASAAGIMAAVLFGYLASVLFKSKAK